MAQKSRARRVTGTLAELTNTSDNELRLAMTLAAAVAGLIAALRLLKFLGDLGSVVRRHSMDS